MVEPDVEPLWQLISIGLLKMMLVIGPTEPTCFPQAEYHPDILDIVTAKFHFQLQVRGGGPLIRSEPPACNCQAAVSPQLSRVFWSLDEPEIPILNLR